MDLGPMVTAPSVDWVLRAERQEGEDWVPEEMVHFKSGFVGKTLNKDYRPDDGLGVTLFRIQAVKFKTKEEAEAYGVSLKLMHRWWAGWTLRAEQ